MRVIAGSARGMNLLSPKGIKTRPTSDRNKEALFSIIGTRLHGAGFLDLYCGSGAMGIEALSRGAAHALFNDASRESLDLTRKNLDKTRLSHLAHLNHGKAETAVKLFGRHGQKFDIIFLDPPYDTDELEMIIGCIRKTGILAEGGLVIAETDALRELPDFPGFCSETRKYGNTKFIFIERALTDRALKDRALKDRSLMEDKSIEDSDLSGQL